MYVYVLGYIFFLFQQTVTPLKTRTGCSDDQWGTSPLFSFSTLHRALRTQCKLGRVQARPPPAHATRATLTPRDVTTRGRSACVCRQPECKRGEVYEPQTLNDRRTLHMYRQTLDVLHWTSLTDKARWN